MLIKILVLSFLSAIFYRLGGIGGKWYFNTKMRDIGCSIITIISLLILGIIVSFWIYIIVFGLSWLTLSAYWGLDEKKFGYWAHGLGLSLALLPIAYITGNWLGFTLRTIVLTASITIWSEYTKWDVLEESGRGFLITATIPLLLI